ncbi:hypothetical protein AN958_06159 [Leucoagaricus sp. SymC.cos]|nr:hypothetical protein AN958_06159 [Leucoagaricus sp. SymC.cos]
MLNMIKKIKGDNSLSQGIKKFAEVVLTNMAASHNTIIKVRVFQTQQVNKHRLSKSDIKINNLVYLVIKT